VNFHLCVDGGSSGYSLGPIDECPYCTEASADEQRAHSATGHAVGATSASRMLEELKKDRAVAVLSDPIARTVAEQLARDPRLVITNIEFTTSGGNSYRFRKVK